MGASRNLARIARKGIITVGTAQDLRDLVIYGGMYPETVETLGVSSVNDGGQGFWRYDPLVTDADNTGTVLAPASGIGRWIRQRKPGYYELSWFGLRGDMSTPCSDVIQSLLDLGSETQPVEIVVPTGDWQIEKELIPGSYCHVRGYGKDSRLRVTDGQFNNLFNRWYGVKIGTGNTIENTYTWISVNDLNPGDEEITFSALPAWVRVGGCFFLADFTEAGQEIPRFLQIVKVVGIVGNTVTIEIGIQDTMRNVRASIGDLNGGDPTRETEPNQNVSLSNLSLIIPYVQNRTPSVFRTNGTYKCTMESLWIEAQQVISTNGMNHSTLTGIFGKSTNNKWVEIAVGSYNVLVSNCRCTFTGAGLPVSFPLISLGERTNRIHFKEVVINAPDVDAKAINMSSTENSSISDVTINCNKLGAGVVVTQEIETGGRNNISNIDINCSETTCGLWLRSDAGYSGALRDLVINDVRVNGEFIQQPSETITPCLLRIATDLNNVHVDGLSGIGQLDDWSVAPRLGHVDSSLRNVTFTGFGASTSADNIINQLQLTGARRTAVSGNPAIAHEHFLNVSSQPANNIVGYVEIPIAEFQGNGLDGVWIVLRGSLSASSTLELHAESTTVVTHTTTTTSAPFEIVAKVALTNAKTSYRVNGSAIFGAAAEAINKNISGLNATTGVVRIEVQAWGQLVQFAELLMRPNLLGDDTYR